MNNLFNTIPTIANRSTNNGFTTVRRDNNFSTVIQITSDSCKLKFLCFLKKNWLHSLVFFFNKLNFCFYDFDCDYDYSLAFPLQRSYFDTIFSFLFPNTANNNNASLNDNYFDQVLNYIMQNDPKSVFIIFLCFYFQICLNGILINLIFFHKTQ